MSGSDTKSEMEAKCPPKIVIDISQDLVKKIKQDLIDRSNEIVIQEPVVGVKKEEESDSDVCIIEEVFGNAGTTSCNDDITFYDDDSQESQLIVPKKTDDITKIKGWRRKQFFVEKPTTVEFEELIYPKTSGKKPVEQKRRKVRSTSPDNVENAFVCDSLDEFLEQEAELKINYEIPHLFAELGIKLTKGEIASGPNLSETDIKEIEMKYCRPVPVQDDVIFLDEIKTEKVKKAKRPIEDEEEEASFKVVKLEDNNLRLVRVVKKPNEPQTNCCGKGAATIENEPKEKISKGLKVDSKKPKACDSKIKLINKDLGLAVYPCPHKPLHPIVQYHLRKLRSYRTNIDENWANFAASALVSKDSQYKRFIVPVKCCMKMKKPETAEETTDEVATDGGDVEVLDGDDGKNTETHSTSEVLNLRISHEDLKRLQDCRVIVEKLDTGVGNKFLCAKHTRYRCVECRSFRKPKSILKPIFAKKTEEKPIGLKQPDHESDLDEDITSLLSKKLKVFNPDSLTSIDSLKTLNRNKVELIKTKFMQKSFLHRYISIWYLKPEEKNVRSRAFLTFSKTPPVPNAINLRSDVVVNDLPKVLKEIIHPEKYIDPDEYVLLLCNGTLWEIHGSVNVAFNKTVKSGEQVIIPPSLPEMHKLQDLSFKLLEMKEFKWCVVDVTQKFKFIELKTETSSAMISSMKLLNFLRYKTNGFVPMWSSMKKRTFGTYVNKCLLPYVLIGPFYVFEVPNVGVRGDYLTFPLVYKETEQDGGDLKRHINSTIKDTRENGKGIESLWLHYKAITDHLCFLEVITKCGPNPLLPRSSYSIQEEHGYSLTNRVPSLSPPNPGSTDESPRAEVYVYFDIISLGYVLGILEQDNSVTISHPFNEKTKVKSSEIGNWFLGMIKRKIQFVPKNLVVNWFVTKEKSHLKNRQPFNTNFLNGSHILTNAGIFYIFKFGESKSQEFTSENSKSIELVSKDSVIDELVHLKSLSDLLVIESQTKLNLPRILIMAANEIIILEEEMDLYERLRENLEKEKLKLLNTYLIGIHLTGANNKVKVSLLKKIENVIYDKNGKISESCLKKLKFYTFGREFLKGLIKEKRVESNSSTILKDLGLLESINHSNKINHVPNPQKSPTPPENDSKPVDSPPTEVKLNATGNQSDHSDASLTNSTTETQLQEKILQIKEEEKVFQIKEEEKIFQVKEEEKIFQIKEEEKFDLDERTESPEKSKKFLKLTSGILPDNVKICVRNTSEEKFQQCRPEKQDAVFETTIKSISTISETKIKNCHSDVPAKSVKDTPVTKNVNGSNFEIDSYSKKKDMKMLKSWKNDKIFFLSPPILFDKTNSEGEKSEQEFLKTLKSFF